MVETIYWDITQQQHIRNLFAKIQNGRLSITYYPTNGEKPYNLTCDMNWTKKLRLWHKDASL